MRSKEGYKDATNNRFSVGNIGLEWLGPSAIVLAICWCVMVLLKVPPSYQIISACSLLIWPIFMFSYLHDRMHVDKYWMTRIPLLRTWFLKSRRLHDIHHRSMNEEGRMDTNFGIGFYFFDRVFGTISLRHRPFNWTGYEIAKERYRYDMCNEGVDEESEAESEAEFPPEINDLPES
jgi:sterol desaturase/sphingolipid hydroxylase (fatty acid hydroxylase superfamily)